MFADFVNGFKCKSNKVCAGQRCPAAPRKIYFFIQSASICTEQIESGRKSDTRTAWRQNNLWRRQIVFYFSRHTKKENTFNFVAMVEPWKSNTIRATQLKQAGMTLRFWNSLSGVWSLEEDGTKLLWTHNVTERRCCCPTVVLLKGGVLAEFGGAVMLLNQYFRDERID